MAKTKPTDEETPKTFESAMSELERCVRKLESNSLGLEEALSEYSQAVEYVEFCHRQLDQARRRIAQLKGITEDGKAVTEPWDDEETAIEEKAGSRTKRKSNG